jgi:glycine/D-amino acid oxidase-like deaminating enzyme
VVLSKPHISKFELANYSFIKDFISKNNIPCDWRTVGAVCGLFSQEEADVAEETTKLLHKIHPELAEKAIFYKDKKDLAKLRMPDAYGAVLHPDAAKVWPYKLVTWVLEQLLRENSADKFNLQTKTSVTQLQRADDSWVLHTERGQVVAKDVLLCTNAYTSHLLPRMTGLIRPIRGQVCALRPPEKSTPLEHSHVWLSRSSSSDDYLIQRDGSGILILGGERNVAAGEELDLSNDDEVNADVGQQLRRACQHVLKLSPGGSEAEQLEAAYEWTGIMGYSRDQHPWVGSVPESLGGGKGLWMSAGYTGHGMPAASRSGIAAAQQILGKEPEIPVPPEFEISEDRAERAKVAAEPANLVEEFRVILNELKRIDAQRA